jgi:hypothetical protein
MEWSETQSGERLRGQTFESLTEAEETEYHELSPRYHFLGDAIKHLKAIVEKNRAEGEERSRLRQLERQKKAAAAARISSQREWGCWPRLTSLSSRALCNGEHLGDIVEDSNSQPTNHDWSRPYRVAPFGLAALSTSGATRQGRDSGNIAAGRRSARVAFDHPRVSGQADAVDGIELQANIAHGCSYSRARGHLQPNDIVFIDSNHVVRSGSEVNFIVLELLPIIPKGVLVQFHDIYLPYDYDRELLQNFIHPNETALVAAFLACNTRYKILFSLSMLHYDRRGEMQSILREYNPESDCRGMRVGEFDQAKHFPSSLWLRVVG